MVSGENVVVIFNLISDKKYNNLFDVLIFKCSVFI